MFHPWNYLGLAIVLSCYCSGLRADENPAERQPRPKPTKAAAYDHPREQTASKNESVPDDSVPEQVIIQFVIIELRGDVNKALTEVGFEESRSGNRYYEPKDRSDVQVGDRLSQLLRTLSAHGEVNILSRPQIRALMNQQATVFVGKQISQIPYLVKTGNKTFELRELDTKEASLGLGVEVTPRPADEPDQIRIDPLKVSTTTLDGREQIEGLDLDVGKPIISTRKLETSIAVPDSERLSGFALPGPPGRQPVLFMTARRVKPDDRTNPPHPFK